MGRVEGYFLAQYKHSCPEGVEDCSVCHGAPFLVRHGFVGRSLVRDLLSGFRSHITCPDPLKDPLYSPDVHRENTPQHIKVQIYVNDVGKDRDLRLHPGQPQDPAGEAVFDGMQGVGGQQSDVSIQQANGKSEKMASVPLWSTVYGPSSPLPLLRRFRWSL